MAFSGHDSSCRHRLLLVWKRVNAPKSAFLQNLLALYTTLVGLRWECHQANVFGILGGRYRETHKRFTNDHPTSPSPNDVTGNDNEQSFCPYWIYIRSLNVFFWIIDLKKLYYDKSLIQNKGLNVLTKYNRLARQLKILTVAVDKHL